VLISEIDTSSCFGEFRPISLSNFTNKIVSKIYSLRLNPMLKYLVSPNQRGFVKERLSAENVLLAQEIIQNISKTNKGGNVVLKLDMAKAYDRMYWHFVISVFD